MTVTVQTQPARSRGSFLVARTTSDAAAPAYAVEDLVAQVELASGALSELRAACPPAEVHAGSDLAGSPAAPARFCPGPGPR
jgi:hypothetical protein